MSRMYCVSQVLKKKVMKTLKPVRDSVFVFKSTINMDAFLFCFSHPPFFSLSITSWIFSPHLLSILTSSSSFSSHPPTFITTYSPVPSPTTCPCIVLHRTAAATSSSSLAQGSYSASSVCAESLGKERAQTTQANKPPASCWGLVLLNVRTEIEMGNLAAELEKMERTVGGKSQTCTTLKHHASLHTFWIPEKEGSITPEDVW